MNILKRIDFRLRESLARKRDFKVTRHIVIFESDDWGAIRVPSLTVKENLISKGYAMDQRPYERFDTLESDRDIDNLAQVLNAYRDSLGNSAQFTLNYLSANPDFDKIKNDKFKNYYWEPISQTYNSYPHSSHVIDYVKKGIESSIFSVQYHGREHFNVLKWMTALQGGDSDCLEAFNYRMCGIFPKSNPAIGNQYMIALNCHNDFQPDIHNEGVREFNHLWGYAPKSFIAPCYTWGPITEQILAGLGIVGIQASRFQRLPNSDKTIVHWTGEHNQYGQIQTVRNCSFEPATSQSPDDEPIKCLHEISRAFNNHNVAIISSHRINYVSGISAKNAEHNLRLLSQLLTEILHKYPDVEFTTSDQLLKEL